MHPLSEQCTATSKRTGKRCQQWVIGGGVCWKHGGAAPQVNAKREQRVLAGELAMRGVPVDRRHPLEALLSAAQDSDEVVQRIKGQMAQAEKLSPELLEVLGDWLDRVGRLAKVVLDGKFLEAAERRENRLNEETARMFVTAFCHAVAAAHVTPEQLDLLRDAMADAMRRIGDLPPMGLDDIPTYPSAPERRALPSASDGDGQ